MDVEEKIISASVAHFSLQRHKYILIKLRGRNLSAHALLDIDSSEAKPGKLSTSAPFLSILFTPSKERELFTSFIVLCSCLVLSCLVRLENILILPL